MTIEIKPLEPHDMEEWLRLHYDSFHPILPMFWYRKPSDESFKTLAERRLPSLSNPGNYTFKAVDTEANNKIVGVANWEVHPEERTAEAFKKSLAQRMPIPEINYDIRDAFMKHINESRVNNMGYGPVVMLGSLIVSPDYQRKGVGTALMKFGVDEADRLGIRAYLEASGQGKGLYEKFGYKKTAELIFDVRPFGHDTVDIHTVMIREPRPKAEQTVGGAKSD